MTTFQIVTLALAAVLVLSVYWENLKGLLKPKKRVIIDPRPVVNTPQPQQTVVEQSDSTVCEDDSLCQLVVYWENLKEECEKRNLGQAASEIDKIFPLLVTKTEEKKAEVKNAV